MRENASRAAGLTRVVALSWLAVAVSTVAHLVAHGEHPSVPTIAAIHGVVAFFLLPVSLAPFSLVRTFLAVLVAQAGVHVGLTLAAVGEASGSVPLPHSAQHAGHGSAAPVATAAGEGLSGRAMGSSVLPTPSMAVAHLVAALALAVLLTRVERAVTVFLILFAHVRRAVAARLFALPGLRPVVDGPGRSGLTRGWDAARLHDVWLSRWAAPRGPPAMSRRPRSAVPSSC